MTEDYWGPSKRVLNDIKFLESLIMYDKDNIPPHIMQKLHKSILNDESFDPDKIKSASTAAEGKGCINSDVNYTTCFYVVFVLFW